MLEISIILSTLFSRRQIKSGVFKGSKQRKSTVDLHEKREKNKK